MVHGGASHALANPWKRPGGRVSKSAGTRDSRPAAPRAPPGANITRQRRSDRPVRPGSIPGPSFLVGFLPSYLVHSFVATRLQSRRLQLSTSRQNRPPGLRFVRIVFGGSFFYLTRAFSFPLLAMALGSAVAWRHRFLLWSKNLTSRRKSSQPSFVSHFPSCLSL